MEARPTDGAVRNPPPWLLPALLVPIGVIVVVTNVGFALSASWAKTHPAALLAMNPRNAIAIAVSPLLSAPVFYTIGLLRLLASDPLYFLLGYFYGERALASLEQRAGGGGRTIRLVQRVFAKASWPLVVVAPNAYVCMLAGTSGMSIPVFVLLNVGGSLGRLYLIRRLGEEFAEPIATARDWAFDHRGAIIGVVVAFLVLQTVRGARRGDGELAELRGMAEDLDEPEDAPTVRAPATEEPERP